MRLIIGFTLLIFCITSCNTTPQKKELAPGMWRAELSVMDNEILPFNFLVTKSEAGEYGLQIMNAEEMIDVDEIVIEGDSITIQTPVFEGYIAGTFTDSTIEGQFIKESLNRIVPFKATKGDVERFMTDAPSSQDVTGIWETTFSPNTADAYVGKGIFLQEKDNVTGTFRTTTGDYRFLEGKMEADSLKLSAFDGAHAFLFTAKVTDSTMNGTFYSGNHFKEPFIAKRNDAYELPSPDSLTFIKEGYDKLAFEFPNSKGEMISLEDAEFKDKVVIVQLMGTWCPNCLDETKFFVDYLKNNPTKDIKIIGLAFESAKTQEKAFEGIERLKNRIEVPYPLLLAQYGSYDKKAAQEKLPMLDHVLSYPTTIFIDKKGSVRRIHTGFNGPATGSKFEEFKTDFDGLINTLVSE